MADMTIADLKDYMDERFANLESRMATKDDVARMATKDDIANMATKDDIANMATKDDISNMATKDDIANMATKDDISNMATKDDTAKLATKADLESSIARLERRITESRQISNKHHLETRNLIGSLERHIYGVSERLSKAADSLQGI